MTDSTSPTTGEREERGRASPSSHARLMALALALAVLLWFVLHLHVLPRRERIAPPAAPAEGTA